MSRHTDAFNRNIMALCIIFLCTALSVSAINGYASMGEARENVDEYTPAGEDEVCYVETSAWQEGNKLVFGNLVMELPDGVTAKIGAEAGMGMKEGQIIILDGAKLVGEDGGSYHMGPFPPKIGMVRYTVKYECEEALICALLDMFPGGNLQVWHEDRENNEYFIAMHGLGDGPYSKYALVRGGELYLIREFEAESHYSFTGLRSQGNVKWQDSGKAIADERNVNAFYFQVAPEEDISLLCHGGSDDWSFYLAGDYDNCYTSIETDESGRYIYSGDLIDINFDGYTDISLSGERAMLWDSEKKEYTEVEYPKDMPHSAFWKSFPETETIWAYSCDYFSEPHDSSNMDYTESLWQWEDFTLVKTGECTAEVREDGVRIRAYGENPDDPMFDENFTLEEWEDNGNEPIWELYRQFYDGRLPEDSSYVELVGEIPRGGHLNGQETIPQGLLDEITASVHNDTGPDTPKGMIDAVRLTDEECYAAAWENDGIRSNILMCYRYVLVWADIDNDGVEDIVGQFHSGASDDSADYIIFQGQADGTYIRTDIISSVWWENFGIIEYDGKNYFVRLLYDYDMQLYDGVSVMAFEDGRCIGEKIIETPKP